jgi:hypothetical protein
MKRVFVSYSRENSDSITQLIHDLQAMGVDAWHDQTLTGGQPWWDNILLNIRQCDVFIFALSPASRDSEACKAELGYVKKLGKTILPVLVADGINKNLLPLPLKEPIIGGVTKRGPWPWSNRSMPHHPRLLSPILRLHRRKSRNLISTTCRSASIPTTR